MNRTKKIFTAIGIIICYLLLDIIGILPLIILNVNTEKLSTLFKMIYIIAYEGAFLFMIYLIYKNDIKKNYKELTKHFNDVFTKYVPYWFLMIILMYIANIILYLITGGIAQNEENVRSLIDNYPIFTFCLSVIIAPATEELIFRKCLREIFTNDKVFIVASGLFFGAMHILFNITAPAQALYIISYAIPGFIFAYIYTKSNNIFSSIGIHTYHNFVLVMIQILL